MNKGDTKALTVNANYESSPSGNRFLGTAHRTLFNAFNITYGGAIEGGVSASSNEFSDALNGIDMSGKNNANEAPRAFLNYIIFDREMNCERARFEQISTRNWGA